MYPSSQTLVDYNAEAVPFPVEPGVYVGTVSASSVYKSLAFEYVSDAAPADGSCAKGSLWALGIEAAMALCLYGIWHVLR